MVFRLDSVLPTLTYCLRLVNKLFQLAVFSHKGSMSGTTQKACKTEVMGKILVSGKRLNLGVRGPGEKPSWGETWSSDTGGSQPGQGSWSVHGGEAHIPQSLGTKGNLEGWPSWEEYRSGGTGGPHPGVDIFLDLSPRAKPYHGVKCSEGLRFPATPFIGKQDSSSTSPESNKGMRPSPV